MRIFDHEDYKEFVRETIKTLPNQGRGQITRMSREIGANQGLLSQVFSGPRDLTLEQACAVADFLGLSEAESQYFLGLVQLQRAGTKRLKEATRIRLTELKENANSVRAKLKGGKVPQAIPESLQMSYYANWYNMAIALLTWIPEYQTPEAIAERLDLPLKRVRETLEFLVGCGMCEEDGGKYVSTRTNFINRPAPAMNQFTSSWRLKAVEKLPRFGEFDWSGTTIVVISKKDQKVILDILQDAAKRIVEVVQSSTPEETVCCLNLDWFEV